MKPMFVLFLVDAKSKVTDEDGQIAKYLKKSGKPVILVVNKVEKFADFESEAHEYLALGLGDPIPVSAVHGMNIGDMLDSVVSRFAEDTEED
jgi:GTP-binding protein